MGKSLIITEKPSVAREFAKILKVSNSGQNGYIENGEYVITWCVGHLVGMVYPESYDIKYKTWKLEDLPFLPEEYKYDVIKSVADQYNIVHNMLQREDIDRVYWAGDAGKEGQTIEENIRNFGGVREGMEELRVWIDSQTEEEILRGLKEAKPMSEYANLGLSGIMRTIEDYAMGINFSRVMTLKYGRLLNDAAGTKSYTAIAVGRVMTCVLGMVVIREREIRNFKETPFYRVIGNFTDANIGCEWKAIEGSEYFESPLLYKENGFKEEKDANELIAKMTGQKAFVKSIEQFTSKKKAPLLFNLAELQAECSKRFKISPNETLQIAQDLYEKKLTTYPRTDARVLSTAIAKEISKNISRLKGYEPTSKYVETIMTKGLFRNIANTQYTDDSKVTDHYAIIPTGQLTEINSLNSIQRAVFDVIVRRFLSIFYPPAEYQNVKLTVGIDKESFFSSTKVLKSEGFLEVATPPKKKDFAEENSRILGGQTLDNKEATEGEENEEQQVNPKVLIEIAKNLKEGDEVSVGGFEIKFGKTSPPKRYTSGSMVLAMENAGQLIEDEELREQIKGSGIGTSATRAEIIDKLVRIGYLNLNPKSQILTPKNLGEMIFEVVSMTVPALLNPKMTASWEKGLDGITQGTVDFWDYRRKLEEFIRTETENMMGQDILSELTVRVSEFAGRDGRGAGARRRIGVKCPMCDGEIVTTPFGFGCSNYKQDKTGCNFNIGEVAGIILSDEQAKTLIEKGNSGTIRGFKAKSGKKFDACLILKKDEEDKYVVEFDFENVEDVILEDVKCPACGGNIKKTFFGYSCVNYDRNNEESCRFSVGEIGGKNLPESLFKTLINEGCTEVIRGFKSKSGNKFDACLILKKDDAGKYNIEFDFEKVEETIIEGVKCPMCQSPIKKTFFGFGCSNYSKDDPNSCRFSIGEMGGKTITETWFKQLLTDGQTEVIRGFKSKNGNKFDAKITFAKDEEGKVTGLKYDFDNVGPEVVKDVVCPNCGGEIVKTPFGFGCKNYKGDNPDSCRFAVGEICGKKLSVPLLKQLLNDKATETIRGFKGKTGNKFDACLVLKEDENHNYQVVFDFDKVEAKKIKDVKCPVCGGDIVATKFGFGCANYKRDDADSCKFSVGEMGGKTISEALVKQLITEGQTDVIRGFKSKAGKKFDARIALSKDENGKVTGLKYDFDNVGPEAIKDVVCPVCGGDMIKTPFGFGCANYKKDDPKSCRFSVGEIGGKKLSVPLLKQLLNDRHTETIRGFKSKSGKKFDACLILKEENNTFQIQYDFDNVEAKKVKDVACPLCGGDIAITPFGYGCSNFKKEDENSCKFIIGKIAGVKLKEDQVKQLLTEKKTDVIKGFVAKTGMLFEAPLKLAEDGKVEFDFPQKPEAVLSDLECPKCKNKMKKAQWNYECDCGFKIGHTVAQVALGEEVLKELFETGKTKEKVVGFTSKAGNVFDACLKFEDDKIQFDFENSGTITNNANNPKSDAGKIDDFSSFAGNDEDINEFLQSYEAYDLMIEENISDDSLMNGDVESEESNE